MGSSPGLRVFLFVFCFFVFAAGCSSSSVGVDGGFDAHFDVAAPPYDAAVPDAAVCGPVDVSSYVPAPLTPPNPPHQNKCTAEQVSDYAQCQGASDETLCAQFADGQPGQACRQCIETQSTDPRWGVIVFAGSDGVYDVAGCVDDALGQLADEKASGGKGSCGDLLFASYGCQQKACGACNETDAFQSCTNAAIQGGCDAYDTPVESSSGPCAVLGAAGLAHCASTSDADAGLVDAGADASLLCGPIDVSTLHFDNMAPPLAPHQGKCTSQQIDDYAQCQGAKNTDLCGQFKAGQPAADCGTCIETQHDGAQWGVVVLNNASTALFNIEGCVDDALGQVSLEVGPNAGTPDGGPAGSCGDRIHWSYACQATACGVCTNGDFAICDSETLFAGGDASAPGECKVWDDLVNDPAGPCAALFSATPPPDAENCFPDTTLDGDAVKQEVDWLTRVATYMCGS